MDSRSLILVVDDQSRGRAALASLLEPEGYRVDFASSGAEALIQMRLLAPDLVLLDVMMPEMDGFEVCRRIRADATLALIPVVMITALDDQGSLLQGIEAGADDFVSKPFNRAELRARIRTITRLNRFRLLHDEQRRAASERAQLLWAIERSDEGYLLLDEEERPQDGNAQGWRYLGISPGGWSLGLPFVELARRQFRLEPAAAWACWPTPTLATRYLVQPEGSSGALWLQVELLDLPRGGPGSRLLHLRDVTAQLTAQRNMWAFHSFVSHKLRTPLTSLLVGLGLLARDGAASLPEHLAPLAEISFQGAQRLKGVVDDIFRYLESPLLLSDAEGVPVEALPELVARVGADLDVQAVSVTAELGPGPCRLSISARTVELLLSELIENSRKFHPRQAPAVHVALVGGATTVVIRVTDDGVTLTPAQLRQIWAPYQQIDDDFTGQVPGIGLGLATVAHTCWAIGGTCRIANAATGPGLTVELELPLAEGNLQARSDQP